MQAITKLPPTRDERSTMEEEVRFPASFEEYWEALEECEYRVEYHDGEIITFMSYATDPHELLVGRIVGLFTGLFEERPDLLIYPSNRPVLKPTKEGGYNPDAFILQGKPVLFRHPDGKTAVTNPLVIVEVLSKSTRTFDMDEKLPAYKQIPSVREIIFIDSKRQHVSIYIRTEDTSSQWLNMDFFEDTEKFPVLNGEISMNRLYRNIILQE